MSSQEFSVPCPCGARVRVTASMAGSVADCRCGRAVRVPRLSKLRRQAGENPYGTNAVEEVRKALNRGELPGSTCVECHVQTNEVVGCRVVCERAFAKGESRGEDWSLLGMYARLLFGGLLPFGGTTEGAQTHGRLTAVETRVCLCPSCQRTAGNLRESRVLKRLLERVPQYQQLFQEYPEATIEM